MEILLAIVMIFCGRFAEADGYFAGLEHLEVPQ